MLSEEIDKKTKAVDKEHELYKDAEDKLDENSVLRIVRETLECYRDGATEEVMVKLLMPWIRCTLTWRRSRKYWWN